MQHKLIVCDAEKCTGCMICDLVCSAVKEGKINPILSRIRTIRLGLVFNIAISCRLCYDAPCVKACPRKALRVNEESGTIIVDEDKCDGCAWCLEACSFGAINIHGDKKVAIICDLCELEPKCINFCPEKALLFTSYQTIGGKKKSEAAKRLFGIALEDIK